MANTRYETSIDSGGEFFFQISFASAGKSEYKESDTITPLDLTTNELGSILTVSIEVVSP
jgi:hypothetical protein